MGMEIWRCAFHLNLLPEFSFILSIAGDVRRQSNRLSIFFFLRFHRNSKGQI